MFIALTNFLNEPITKKSEIDIHRFIQILNRLDNKDLSALEMKTIEHALGGLSLNSNSVKTIGTSRRHSAIFKNRLKRFFY